MGKAGPLWNILEQHVKLVKQNWLVRGHACGLSSRGDYRTSLAVTYEDEDYDNPSNCIQLGAFSAVLSSDSHAPSQPSASFLTRFIIDGMLCVSVQLSRTV